jgi:hypothetical protein
VSNTIFPKKKTMTIDEIAAEVEKEIEMLTELLKLLRGDKQ